MRVQGQARHRAHWTVTSLPTLCGMRRLVGLVAAVLLTAACGSSGGTEKGVTTKSSVPSTTGTSAATPVTDALDFTLPGVTGPQIRGTDHAGRSLALWFWAPW